MNIKEKVALITGARNRQMSTVTDEIRKVGRKVTTIKADMGNRDDVCAAINHADRSSTVASCTDEDCMRP